MRSRRLTYLAATGISIALLTTACGGDGQSGIPTDPPEPQATSVTNTTVTNTTATTTTATTTTAAPTTTLAPPPLAAGMTVATPPAAVEAWSRDVVAGNIAPLTSKCWMVPPTEVSAHYGDAATILGALAKPGTVSPQTIDWTDGATTYSFNRVDITTGYACPTVRTGHAQPTDADAAYTVTRYLSRAIGEPVNPADVEASYPLVCSPTPDWDPSGTNMPIVPPLSTDKNLLDASVGFDSTNEAVTPLRAGYVQVTADVTNSAGVVITRTLTLDVRGNGYCIGEVA